MNEPNFFSNFANPFSINDFSFFGKTIVELAPDCLHGDIWKLLSQKTLFSKFVLNFDLNGSKIIVIHYKSKSLFQIFKFFNAALKKVVKIGII